MNKKNVILTFLQAILHLKKHRCFFIILHYNSLFNIVCYIGSIYFNRNNNKNVKQAFPLQSHVNKKNCPVI